MGYPQMIGMVEEILIIQAYKFDCKSNTPIIIDCGSNVGLSIMYFKLLFPSAQVTAFEPDKESFELLEKNILHNRITGVSLYNSALSNITGETILHKRKQFPGYLGMSLKEYPSSDWEQVVSMVRLSDYLKNEVDLIKIDVEGSEVEIIDDLITNDKIGLISRLIIEFHFHLVELPIESLISRITQHNFACTILDIKLNDRSNETIIYCVRS